jgi:uncharacterized hydrophobic protein (TIGR00271 family)
MDGKILDQVADQARLTPSYLVFMAMAGVLAGVALLTNSVPILVGSMVIAPALPPLALVGFALVGGRPPLALRGLGVGLLGLLVATVFAVLATWVLNITNVIPPETNLLNKPLLEERVHPGWYSIAAAFAAGVVGTLALTKQKTDTLVGTVAALALVPAGAAAGIAFDRAPHAPGGGVEEEVLLVDPATGAPHAVRTEALSRLHVSHPGHGVSVTGSVTDTPH